MLTLDATTKKLEIILGGAVTTSQLPFVVVYVDYNTSAKTTTPATADGQTNDTTDVDLVAAPGANVIRQVRTIVVQNDDTAAATVTIKLDNSGTDRKLIEVTLAANDTLQWTIDGGWGVVTGSGEFKTSGSGGGGSGISDGDTLSTGLTFPNSGLKVLDSDASHCLTFVTGSNLSGHRTLTFTTGDADRNLTLNSDTTLGGGSHSGTNTGDQTIELTGDVTGTGAGSFTATIADEAVSLAKMAHVATATILGRVTAATGDVEAMTAAQARTVLNVENGATADMTGAEIKAAYEAESDTNAFTDALQTKLGGIESGADVTDATNVNAAGAVMNSDTTTAAMSFVVDEDDMSSNSATKVPTQQSVKAYVDGRIAGDSRWRFSTSGAVLTLEYDTTGGGSWAEVTSWEYL